MRCWIALAVLLASVLVSPPVQGEIVFFDIDAARSNLIVTLDAGFAVDASSGSAVSGAILVDIEPGQEPFSNAHVQGFDASLIDGTDLSLTLGLATIEASAAPGEIQTELIQAGPAGEVVDQRFSQSGNLFQLSGAVHISVLEDPFDLGTLAPVAVDLEDMLFSVMGSTIEIEIPVKIEVKSVLTDVPIVNELPVFVNLDGTIIASGQFALVGDFDGDRQLTASDIDTLTQAIANNEADLKFDLNDDGQLTSDDRDYWIEQIRETSFGDSTLDGKFDSTDFVQVFQAGEYEDEVESNSTWATGDWNGDQEFDSGDFVAAFKAGSYETDAETASVPEPGLSWGGALTLLFCLLGRRRRSGLGA